MRNRRWAWALAAVVVLGSGAVACSHGGGSKFNTVGSRIDGGSSVGASAESGAAASALPGGARPAGRDVGVQAQANRDVVYTGSVTVRVPDAPKAAVRARGFADAAGGYLAKQDADLEGAKEISSTLRVPSDRFDAVVDQLAKLGTVQARRVDSDDVTDKVVDLRSRLKNAQISADRLRELLAKAEVVQNVITIEDRLTQRETQIEQLEGELQVVEDQVDLATIRVTFTESDKATVSKDLPGFVEALRSGAVTLGNIVLVLVAAAAFALPFLPLVVLGWWLRRQWRHRHPKAAGPDLGGPGPQAPWKRDPPPAPATETAADVDAGAAGSTTAGDPAPAT